MNPIDQDPEFDLRISDWLEADPDVAPSPVLALVAAAIPSIPQRASHGAGMPRGPLSLDVRIAAAVAAGLIVVGGVSVLLLRPGGPTIGAPAANPPVTPPVVASSVPIEITAAPGRLLLQSDVRLLDVDGFDEGDAPMHRLYITDADGEGISEFLPDLPPDGKIDADVSFDGTHVVYSDAGFAHLYEAALDGTGFHELNPLCTCSEDMPAYAPDGRRIAFTQEVAGDAPRLAIRDLDTWAVQTLPATVGTVWGPRGGDIPTQPAWSPDGRTVAYAMTRSDGSGQVFSSRVFVVDTVTGVTTDLDVPPALWLGSPRFSPDGTRLLLVSTGAGDPAWVADGARGLYTIRPDGSELTLVAAGARDEADWSPDGQRVVYLVGEQVWVADADGANAVPWSRWLNDLGASRPGGIVGLSWIDATR